MKIVSSKRRAAEREAEMLRLENTNLKQENCSLRTELERYRVREMRRQRRSQGRKDLDLKKLTSRTSTQMPSYLLPTIATTNRKVEEESTEPARKTFSPSRQTTGGLQYEDGKLIDAESLTKTSFMKPTTSSMQKVTRTAWILQSSLDSSLTPSPVLSAVDSVLAADAMRACEWCESIDRNEEDRTDQPLEARSRLRHDEFFNTPASKCPVRHRVQQRLMRAGLRHAQVTLWLGLREHWPRVQRYHYLEGPDQVKFGRDELSRVFGNDQCPNEANETCFETRQKVNSHMLEVVYLRNAVCHPVHTSTREIDDLLRKAQQLAVLLKDETRAFKIRKIRDELQSRATEVYQEIESRAGMAALPYARPWPLYIQRFFSEINVDPHLGVPSDLPDVIVQAARDWKLKYVSPGELNPDYLACVSRAKSFVGSTRTVPRPSWSLGQNFDVVW